MCARSTRRSEREAAEQLRAIVARCEPVEHVVLANLQLIPLA